MFYNGLKCGGGSIDLPSLTQGTATASDISSGKTAWVNGEKINIESIHINDEFLGLIETDGLQIGSLQGNTRSTSHYNEIGVYDKTMTLEELITLTQI